MRKLIVSEFVSLDGVMQAPGGEPEFKHTGWVFKFQGPDQERYKLDETLDAGALLIGRKTYQGFADAWPERSGEFADKMNGMPKYVVSTTLADPEWENTTVLGDVADVAELKEGDGGDILVAGSRTLVNALKARDLVDEYRMMVFPIVLGSGMRLFDDADDTATLRLVDTKPFQSGAVVLTYESARD